LPDVPAVVHSAGSLPNSPQHAPDALRVEYDSNLDELVDTQIRLAHRTPNFRRSRARHSWTTGASAAVGCLAVLSMTADDLDLSLGVFGLLVGLVVLAGTSVGLLYRPYYDWIVRRHCRRMAVDQIGNVSSIRVEIAILADRVWTRQHGIEMSFPWSSATGVEDTEDAITIWFSPGIVVLRNRAFSDATARQAFLARARALAFASSLHSASR